MFIADNRFVFTARGIDASVLGLKVGVARPDLIVFDDIEPDESSYSVYQAKKRLVTVTDTIMPMNVRARIVFVGTVTMPGGITHQLVSHKLHPNEDDPAWIVDESVIAHYYPAIVTNEDGSEESLWPEKWPWHWMVSQRHTRSFAKNFMNLPITLDGDYWLEEDFRYGNLETATRTIISIDPAVTTSKAADFTGVAVISYSPSARKCVIRECLALKLSGDKLRARVLALFESDDYVVSGVLIESNQGGDTWLSVFHDMPCRVRFRVQTEKKEIRATNLLDKYQRKNVLHARPLSALQEQMLAYPNVLHDDLIDAVGTGVEYFMRKRRKHEPAGSSVKYD
jgi:phage terminase large subunit-like protein